MMDSIAEDTGWLNPLADADDRLLHQIGMAMPSSLSSLKDAQWVKDSQELVQTDSVSLSSEASIRKRKKASSAVQLPALAEIVSWPDLVRQHAILLESKNQMDGRRFNKTALDLLNACVQFLKKEMPSSGIANPGSASQKEEEMVQLEFNPSDPEWHAEKAALAEFRLQLLSENELKGEDFVNRVVSYIEQGVSPLLTADEKRENLLKKSMAFMQELSPALSLKMAPIVKSCVSQRFDSKMEYMFAEINLPEMDIKEKALLYRRMLANFIDNDHCISFATTNRRLLGKLTPKDVWFLTFFACVTARRSRGDNLLQLGCVGKSSVGKSMLFESILLTTGHQVLSSASSSSSEAGVGRYNLGAKNSIIFHDINIATLVGADLEKVKSLTRTENCIAKIHSSTVTIAPVFVVYTANERLFRHVIPAHLSGKGMPIMHRSELDDMTTTGKKKISSENLEAVRARFLEMYCFKTPKQDPDDLERCGTFERPHFILGTFDRALSLLEETYSPTDFHSPHLAAYVLSALVKNIDEMERVMCSDNNGCQHQHRQRLQHVQEKYSCIFK